MIRRKMLNLLSTEKPETDEVIVPRVEASGDEATIYLYDVIDEYWGISAASFAQALDQITASTLHLRIACRGGDVFQAVAMKAALERHKATTKIAHVDGLAASAASVVMLGCPTIEIARGGMVMVHNAWSWAVGNASEMRRNADLLDKIDGQIAAAYVAKTGEKLAAVQKWMADETWFTEEEAVEAGLCDKVEDKDAVENKFDLSIYQNAPKNLQRPKPDDIDAEALKMARAAAHARLALFERT